MPVDWVHLAGMALVICLGGVLQSAVGFAFGLFATPLLVLLGMPLPSTIAAVAVCSFAQALIGTGTLWAAIPWRPTLAATAIRTAGLTAGLLVLKWLAGLSSHDVKLAVGLVLCGLLGVQALARVQPAAAVHWLWGGVAFTASGFMAGVCGMGGPPLVMWSLARDWSVQRIRGFLFAVFALSLPMQLALLWALFGHHILRSALTGAMLIPAVLLGAAIGLPIGNRLPKPRLRVLTYVILLVIGVSSVVQGLAQRSW